MASADMPDEGHRHAARGLRQAARRARRRAAPGHPAEPRRPHRAADRQPGIAELRVASSTASPTPSWSRSMGSAEVACVPSLYEGFSLPTVEPMACETPLVVSRAGAIPEVVGPDGRVRRPGHPRRRRRAARPRSPRCSTTRSGGPGWAPPGAAGCWSGSAGARSPRRRRRRTRRCGRAGPALQDTRPGTSAGGRRMLTVDFERLGLRPGERVLDMGCGAGRHAFEMYRRGADVVALDQDADELAGVARAVRGDARGRRGAAPAPRPTPSRATRSALPFADGEFDRVVASEVLEHIPEDVTRDRASWCGCCGPAARWRSPCRGGCPSGSAGRCRDEYHANEGGHVRIYTGDELVGEARGRRHGPRRHATTRTRCTRRTGGSSAPSASTKDEHPLVRGYHRLLVWDIMQPAARGSPGSPSGC